MKIILFSLTAVLLIIVVQCLDQTETNIKPAASQGEAYDKCQKGKKGKNSCRCGKKKVVYNRARQDCINGKVVKR